MAWQKFPIYFLRSIILYTVVWEKFMVRNIREKKIRGKKFSSKQATDENILKPNISYMHMHTYMYLHQMKFSFVTCAALIKVTSRASYY